MELGRTRVGFVATVAFGSLLALAGGVTPAGADIGDITTYDDAGIESPVEIAAGADGNLWFSQQSTASIGRITPEGVVTVIPLPGGSGAGSIAAGADGLLWATLPATDSIARIVPAGAITEFTDPEAEVDNPSDLAAGPDGNMWFTSFGNHRVGFITPSGDITTFVDGDDPLEDPSEITSGPDGNLWVAHGPENVVAQLATVTTAGDVTDVPIPNDIVRIGGLVTGPDGNIWFTSPVDDRIGRVTPAGVVTMFTDVEGEVDQPEGITAGPDGNLWLTSSANDRLARVTTEGDITTFTDPTGDADRPLGITAAPGATGDIWFTLLDGDRIGRIEPTDVASAPAVSTTPGDAVVNLSWTPPTDTGGLPITSYVVRRDGVEVHETADGFATSFTDEAVANGTSYEYEVAATNARGEGPGDVALATPRTVPGMPTGLNAIDGEDPNEIDLSWGAPGSNGGAAITGYRIYRDGVPVHTTTTSATTYSDPGRTNRTTYQYEVAAVNLVGTGQRSTAAEGTAEYDCPASEPAFSDVGESHLFYGDICWMDDEAISTGFGDGTYRPSLAVSRSAMSAFMFRLAGITDFDAPGTATFDDVKTTHQFFEEVEWMAFEGITTGYSDDTFRPSAAVSRGAMSAFLYRLAGKPLSPSPPQPTFSDVSLAHQFSQEVEWMAATNISTGFADGTYQPSAAVSRQSMSAFLHRLADGPGVAV
jgi:streptogramin lyase